MGRFLCCWGCLKEKEGGSAKEREEEKEEWLKSFHGDHGRESDEQSRHAMVVAAATAAAADAAVAAAQAAAAVVRLTSAKRRSGCKQKDWAAVKIQSAFRGYLARKALKALRSLVKLQALVKGYLVRKQAASTLQALIRARTAVKYKKSPIFLFAGGLSQPLSYHRRSLEREQQGSMSSQKTVKMDTFSSIPYSSPLPIRCRNLQEGSSVTTNSTPRFLNYECDSPNLYPNYMASTRSFDAKVRSQSTPKHRPELSDMKMRRRVPLHNEAVDVNSRASLSALSFKNAVGRVDRVLEVSRDEARDYHLMKRW